MPQRMTFWPFFVFFRLTFVFLRHRDRLRKSDTLSSLNVLRSSLKPSRGNFLRAY